VVDDGCRGARSSMTDQVLAADGRVIGARAYKTRARLLDATNELLEERGALGLRVVDITRQIGSSPATFYQYFQDVEDAILALAEEATADVSSFAHFFDSSRWRTCSIGSCPLRTLSTSSLERYLAGSDIEWPR